MQVIGARLGECVCCDDGKYIDCCVEGLRGVFVGIYFPSISKCGGATDHYYSVADGASGTSNKGVGINITNTNESRILGVSWSSSLGDLGEIVLCNVSSNGPYHVELTAPAGMRICYVGFHVGAALPGPSKYDVTMYDTEGSVTKADVWAASDIFNGCNGTTTVIEGHTTPPYTITKISFERHPAVPVDTPGMAIGPLIALCMVPLNNFAGDGDSEGGGESSFASAAMRTEPCLYLGPRIEYRTGCSGWTCKHDCLHENHEYAVPGGVCQTCLDYEPE